MLKPELLEERIFNSITWAPRIWRPWDNLFDCRVLFCSEAKRSTGRFVLFRYSQPRSIEFSFFFFRIGPERRRKAEMPTDLCLFSNSPDPIVPVFGTSSAKVTEWVSHQSNPFDKSGVILDIIFYIYRNIIE